MTLARIHSASVLGIHACVVDVEVDHQVGLPSFSTVGLPDESVRESRDRVRAALANSGFDFPTGRVTVNLAPADLRKEGAGFDLAIAVGLLAVAGQVPLAQEERLLVVGELSLDGSLKAVRGVLPMALAARKAGFRGMVVPPSNTREATLVAGLTVYEARSLKTVARFLQGETLLRPAAAEEQRDEDGAESALDFDDVCGQDTAKRVMEVAAAGGHNFIMIGPPGAGKTMLARRLPTILPSMSFEEALQTTRIYSVANLLSREVPLVRKRPFRAPHHTVSCAGMAGGGAHPRPGEISLAHNGVLFLDELPEFSRRVLEVLRQPLEEGRVTIARAALSLTYPAGFMLIAAMNPCKCGWLGHRVKECRCTPREVERYRGKISGPLLDRIDIHLEVPPLEYHEMTPGGAGEASAIVRRRVEKARVVQQKRFAGNGTACNAGMSAALVRSYCRLDREGDELLRAAVDKLGLSVRGAVKILKVARTIADLSGVERIGTGHLAEAVQYRSLDRGIM